MEGGHKEDAGVKVRKIMNLKKREKWARFGTEEKTGTDIVGNWGGVNGRKADADRKGRGSHKGDGGSSRGPNNLTPAFRSSEKVGSGCG